MPGGGGYQDALDVQMRLLHPECIYGTFGRSDFQTRVRFRRGTEPTPKPRWGRAAAKPRLEKNAQRA